MVESHGDRCYQKDYQLEAGNLEISVDYSIDSKKFVKDSAVYVLFDGQVIHKILPTENGKNIKLKGRVSQGSHKIGFCMIGAQNEAPHQVTIANIRISQPL